MKQLLAVCDDYFVVGLHDRAFVTCIKKDSIVRELKPSSSQDSGNQGNGSGDKNREIQAVAITRDETSLSSLLCAVSRIDKSLEIYRIDTDGNSTNDSNVELTLSHSTNKRVGCLCFGTLPPTSTDEATTVDENSGEIRPKPSNLVIVAGDLAGDVYAYSLEYRQRHRLLLGHTASMITGVCVRRNLIFTSDRDEKIRISQFPGTYVIDGFLLGHTAYVTAMDVVPENSPCTIRLIVSCGGDGTVRFWNADSFQQLLEIKVGDACDEKSDQGEENNRGLAQLIPTSVAIDPCGRRVAVIFDNSARLEIYQIAFEKNGDKLSVNVSLQERLDCSSQPLSVKFQSSECLLVLLRDPEYCVAYEVREFGQPIVPQKVDGLCQLASSANIVMPDTILEKDAHGQPKLQKLKETRVADVDAPWNRVERVDIAKKREKRAKKRRKER